MQKSSCFYVLLIMAITIVASIKCNETQAAIKKQIVIELHLSEVKSNNCIELEGFDFNDSRDEYICSVLGIEWKKQGETNKYFVQKAFFKNSECLGECWIKTHPKFLPLPKIPHYTIGEKFKAPSRFPASFVEKLKQNKEKGITLEPKTFQTPITITFKLVYIKPILTVAEGQIESLKHIVKGLDDKKLDVEQYQLKNLIIQQQLRKNTRLLHILNIGAVSIGALTLLLGLDFKYFCLLQSLLYTVMLCL